jgi:hypothetical protein
VIIGEGSLRGQAGKALTVRYATTLLAVVTLELRKRGRLVLRTRGHAKAGRNTVRIGHLPSAAGGYTLKLIANAAGQSATDHASVTVTVPPVHKPKPIAPPPEQEPAEG